MQQIFVGIDVGCHHHQIAISKNGNTWGQACINDLLKKTSLLKTTNFTYFQKFTI